MDASEHLPAYNVQTAVDTEHALIVAHSGILDAADSRCLQPMAEAARMALRIDNFQIVAGAGHSMVNKPHSVKLQACYRMSALCAR